MTVLSKFLEKVGLSKEDIHKMLVRGVKRNEGRKTK